MPVVRSHGTSVRERIAAIEKKESVIVGRSIENTVIRAKYEPDVRGINRFRHFHTPILLNDISNNSFGKDMTATHLPSLVNPAQQNQPINRNADNGMEKGTLKKMKNITLPQLRDFSKQPKSSKEDATTRLHNLKNERIKQTVVHKTSSESDTSEKTHYSRLKLKDGITVQSKHIEEKRTFASLGQRQNGAIINRPMSDSLEVTLPPRSKSAQDIEARAGNTFSSLAEFSMISLSASLPRHAKDMATQTSKKHISTASVEFLNCVRSTQTDSTPIVINSRRKSDIPPSLQDIEEREALLEVIEDALGETFDRYSRVRTNQIIANSARKQAQIWRDVKSFLGAHLFPTAIQLANKSQTQSKTAAEIVASIKMYP